MKIQEVMKLQRKALGITQQDLADMSEIASSTIKKIESGKGNPSLSTIEKIMDNPWTTSPEPNLFLRIVLQVPDFLRWHAADEGVVGDILGHYGACSHHHIVADGDAGQDGDIAAYPHVVADAHGLGDAQVLAAAHRRERVVDGGDERTGPIITLSPIHTSRMSRMVRL